MIEPTGRLEATPLVPFDPSEPFEPFEPFEPLLPFELGTPTLPSRVPPEDSQAANAIIDASINEPFKIFVKRISTSLFGGTLTLGLFTRVFCLPKFSEY
ncbi:MAG TPA: hypothetical protein VKQ09_05370 [Sphingomonas sp.]|nr:hypothetical protein [Sphingomonas sp.]